MGYERDRGTARQRGYGQRWFKAAETFKSRQPWCLGCQAQGRRTKAELVDHVEPHKGDQRKFWDTAMWQPCCRHCHDVVKQRLERMFESGEIKASELWLNSKTAIALGKRHAPLTAIGADGWGG